MVENRDFNPSLPENKETNPRVIERSLPQLSKFYIALFIDILTQFCNMYVWINFYILFFVTMYYFIFYKMSDNVTLLMPSNYESYNVYDIFTGYLVVLLVFKTVYVLFAVIKQATADVILIDWEPERKVSRTDEDKSVVAWRSIFISNEFNEL